MASYVLKEEVEIVYPDSMAAPAAGNADKSEPRFLLEAMDWYEWLLGKAEFDYDKGDEENNTKVEYVENIRRGPTGDWSLIQGKVEKHQSGDTGE